jgi:hypothetical protein
MGKTICLWDVYKNPFHPLISYAGKGSAFRRSVGLAGS